LAKWRHLAALLRRGAGPVARRAGFFSGLQSLADCVAYPFTPTGGGVANPIFAQIETGLPADLGQVNNNAAVSGDVGLVAGVVLGSADLGAAQ
jgi:hypothetical protein